MEDTDLEKYKSAWKKEQSFNNKILSESEIKNYLRKRSSEITRSFKAGLIFDIIIKACLAISFIYISLLFSFNTGIPAISIASIIIISVMVIFQINTYRKIPELKEYSDNVREFLESKIRFYRGRYFISVYITALSNPLIFICGMIIYSYFKYGEVKPMQFEDYLVFGLACIIGFAMGAFFQIKQYNFQISQLEACLSDLDEKGINENLIRKRNRQRKRMLLIFIVALLLGLLVLGYLII
jgi:hypothetical protein